MSTANSTQLNCHPERSRRARNAKAQPQEYSQKMKYYYVYIFQCSDGSFYTGITSNLEQRWEQHRKVHFKTCYTFKRRPLQLKYTLEFNDVLGAIRFEKQVKKLSRVKKMALITKDLDSLQLLAECRNYTHSKYQPFST